MACLFVPTVVVLLACMSHNVPRDIKRNTEDEHAANAPWTKGTIVEETVPRAVGHAGCC